ncbi:MAG: ABC transporter ATP-binding protein [Vampirovibrionales bacterium]|nr:ABC transporter ATP-binding protein [Vampirovibrionales bacterium]
MNVSANSVLPIGSPDSLAMRVEGIKKQFGQGDKRIEALRGVSFEVQRGEVFSILGPNGAGKTTLLRILTTITRPDAGEFWLDGVNARQMPKRARQKLGVVFQNNQFSRYLSIWQNLELHAKMHGLARADYEPKLIALLKQQGLYERRNDLTEPLSGGMKRRVALIRAMIQEPSVLFLDEPTTGLDPHARRELWADLEAMKSRCTIILTTHYMDEADALSDRILLLNHGQVVNIDTPDALKRAFSPNHKYEVVLNCPQAEPLRAQLTPLLPAHASIWQDNPFRLVIEQCDETAFWHAISSLPPGQVARAGRIFVDLESVFLAMKVA